MFIRNKTLKRRVEQLENVIPKLYKILVRSQRVIPCEQMHSICRACEKRECIYHLYSESLQTAESIIEDILHT